MESWSPRLPMPRKNQRMIHSSHPRRHCLPLTATPLPCFRDVSPIRQKLKILQPQQAQESENKGGTVCRAAGVAGDLMAMPGRRQP